MNILKKISLLLLLSILLITGCSNNSEQNVLKSMSKDITNSKIQALVDNYNPNEFEKYTYQSIKSMYE